MTPNPTVTRLKALVGSAFGFVVLIWPALAAAIPQADIMQGVLGGYALYHLIRLVIDQVHGAMAGAVVLALLMPGAAMAQEPDRGGLFLAYNLTSLEVGMDRAAGWTLEGDAHIPQFPAVSLVGHISATNTIPGWTFSGIGPRGEYDFGAVKLFAHWLIGSVKVGDLARPGLDHKGGGGLMIPLGRRWEIQLGGDHDGDYAHGRVGFGWRF